MLDTFKQSIFLASALTRQRWTKDKLEKFQEKCLKSLINHAYNCVPYYHHKFKREKIDPHKLRKLDDLSKISITTKDHLRKEDISGLLSTQFPMNSLRIQLTSGSTGKPFAIYLNPKEESWRKAISLRANINCGQKMRDKWILIRAPHHFSDSSVMQKKLNIFSPINLPILTNLDHQLDLLRRISPDIIDGYSGTLHLLAKEIKSSNQEGINPRMIFGTAELIDSRACQFIEEVFEAPYYDQFGCSEFDRTAWQCSEKLGYHMDVDSVITQFVDEDGIEVSPGKSGNIVYTSLFNYSMPFIRYETGDLGIASDEICSCGRTLPIMKVIEGRRDDFLRLSDGTRLSPRVLTNALSSFEYYLNIVQFRIVQEEIGLINILIEKQNDAIPENRFKNALLEHLFREFPYLFKDAKVQIKLEKIHPEKSGKRRAVISKVVN